MVTNSPANIKTAAIGKILQGQGIGVALDFSTATYPSTSGTAGKVLISDGTNIVSSTPTFPNTAVNTGTILRADGTNWVATSATYPATTTINQILYSSAANTISGLATANSGVLTTSTAGVPSIDTTNFHVLTTGVQMKGNNTNTAPPVGFIGEKIESVVGVVAMVSDTAKSITSIDLTAGNWLIYGAIQYSGGAGTGTITYCSISTTTNTLGTDGNNSFQMGVGPVSGVNDSSVFCPAVYATIASTTTYYLVGKIHITVGSVSTTGARITATRVG